MRDFLCGISFARAVGEYFKLPPDTSANMAFNCRPDDIFSLDVTLTLTADDLAGIADLMEGRSPKVPTIVEPGDFDAWMRYRTDRAHAEYMARHAAGGIDYSKH